MIRRWFTRGRHHSRPGAVRILLVGGVAVLVNAAISPTWHGAI